MKTLVTFQLDLIRRANYSAFHSHLKTLFGEQSEQFVENTLPIVNQYKQAKITEENLFQQLREQAHNFGVAMDEVGVRAMWDTLHPDANLLVQDVRFAIEHAQHGHEMRILSYNSKFATDDFQAVLQTNNIDFVTTDYGILIANKIEVHFSHRAVACKTATQFFENKFAEIEQRQKDEELKCIYLSMDLSQLPSQHKQDLSAREELCLALCEQHHYDVATHNYEMGRLDDYLARVTPLVHELVEQHANIQPNKIALVFDGQQITYAELNSKANQLAHYLIKRGVGPEKMVAVVLERGINLIISLLAILKVGGAYICIDPNYPSARIKSILASSDDIVALISEKQISKILIDSEQSVIALDQDSNVIKEESQENLPKRSQAKNLVYVGFTSGSTGIPKGVLVEMHSLLNLIGWHRRHYGITSEDRFSFSAGVGFVVATREIWSCLTAGASLHIVKPGIESDLESLLRFFREEKITITYLPTPLVEILLQRPAEPISVTRILTGGSKLKVYPTTDTPFKLYNHYGTTETAATVTHVELKPSQQNTSIIGQPIDNQQIYIIDENLCPVSNGEIGELCISGEGVSRGYLNDPDLNATSFIASPFLSGKRLFKTGDRVRMSDQGIEFIGRNDSQIKIRGMRVELAEIENVLQNHSAINQVIILAKESPTGIQLIASIISKDGITAGDAARQLIDTLRRDLGSRLPDYMIPTAFMLYKRFPVNSSGKVDRVALQAVDVEQAMMTVIAPMHAPETALENQLLTIWKKQLGLSNLGIDHLFHEVGGNSLIITTLREQLENTFNLPIKIEHITTVRELAKFIVQLQSSSLTTKSSIDDQLTREFIRQKTVYDQRSGLTYKVLELKDIEMTAKLIGETFADPQRGEPMTSVLGISTEVTTALAQPFCCLGAEQELSTATFNANGEMVGVSIAFDGSTPDPEIDDAVMTKFAPIFTLLETADSKVKDFLADKGPVVHRFIIAIKPGAPSNVAYLLHKLGNETAKAKGYKMSLTEPTGPISQSIVKDYGYTLHEAIPYDEFEFEGEKVFQDLPKIYNQRGIQAGFFKSSLSFFGCPAATRPLSPPLPEINETEQLEGFKSFAGNSPYSQFC